MMIIALYTNFIISISH